MANHEGKPRLELVGDGDEIQTDAARTELDKQQERLEIAEAERAAYEVSVRTAEVPDLVDRYWAAYAPNSFRDFLTDSSPEAYDRLAAGRPDIQTVAWGRHYSQESLDLYDAELPWLEQLRREPNTDLEGALGETLGRPGSNKDLYLIDTRRWNLDDGGQMNLLLHTNGNERRLTGFIHDSGGRLAEVWSKSFDPDTGGQGAGFVKLSAETGRPEEIYFESTVDSDGQDGYGNRGVVYQPDDCRKRVEYRRYAADGDYPHYPTYQRSQQASRAHGRGVVDVLTTYRQPADGTGHRTEYSLLEQAGLVGDSNQTAGWHETGSWSRTIDRGQSQLSTGGYRHQQRFDLPPVADDPSQQPTIEAARLTLLQRRLPPGRRPAANWGESQPRAA